MLPDQVSNPGSLTYESGALPIALRGPAGGGGGGGRAPKPKQQTVSNEVITKMQLST